MAHFQIYLPGRRHLAPNDLAAVGLGGLERDGDRRPTSKFGPGPDGGRGLFVAWSPEGEAPAYWPQRQTWLPMKHDEQRDLPAGRCFMGFDDQSAVSPKDLERDSPCFEGGSVVVLDDGQTWTVPWLSWLLFRSRVNASDQHCRLALDAYAALELAQRAGEWDPIFSASFALCGRLLALNYRLTTGVAHKLGLFDSPDNVAAIMAASITAPRIQTAALE
jgi:hypothetical protein